MAPRVWTLPEDGQPATWIEPTAGSLPPGGTTGEVLTKESDADGDAGWKPGGGSSPALSNWALVSLANCPAFDAGSGYNFAAADLTIDSQSGSDFSIDADPDSPSYGAVLSAAGGWFQCGLYAGPPGGVTLDGGKTSPRYLWLGANLGRQVATNPFRNLGLDLTIPVTTDSDVQGSTAQTLASVPGKALAGEPALTGIFLYFAGSTGTDHITNPISNFTHFALWQAA